MRMRPRQVVLAVLASAGLNALLVLLLARKAAFQPEKRPFRPPEVEFQVETPETPEPRNPTPPSEQLPLPRQQLPRKPPSIARAAPFPSALEDPALGIDPPTPLSDGLNRDDRSQQESRVPDAREVTDPPSVMYREFPRYPASAAAQGTEGFVVLRLLIDTSGRVLKAEAIRADPPGVFEDAAVAAVRAWRFRPARDQGRAVAVWARQTLKFELQ